jgi:hypothetical protein
MAISINQTPDAYEPVYTNSMPFVVSSIFQTKQNYKYLFSLNIGATPILISTYPRPDGYGIYSPHYALQANCETDLDPSITTIKSNSASKVKYYFNFGEQYNPGLTFGDTYLTGSYLGNKLGLEFTTNIISQIFVGDLITIQKDNIGINPWINGTASVIGITNSTLPGYSKTVFLDKGFGTPTLFTSNESGAITTITRYSATSSLYIGWNASRQYGDFTDFGATYAMDIITEKSFLSAYETAYTNDLTEKKPIYINDYETLDILVATISFASYPVVYCSYVYYDSNNTNLGSDSIDYVAADGGNILRYAVPTGTQNIFDIGGSGSSFISNGLLDHYEVIIGLGDGSNPIPDDDISRRFNYQVISNCRPYEVVRLAFLNKLGGYDYWNFNLVSKYKSNLKRTQIDRSLDPQYVKGDRGRDVIYSTAVENWTINTDFLTDTDALFIRELVESSSVFIVETDDSILPVVITENTWDYKSGLLNGYVQYTIDFQKSYDVIINR